MITDKTALANAYMFDHAYRILNEKFTIGLNANNLADIGLSVPIAVIVPFHANYF